ncbi:type VII secretion system (T7SS), usher family protein, partial [Escherichia coli]
IGPDPRNFNQRVSLGRNDLLIRTFLKKNSNFPLNIVLVMER